MCSCSSQTWRIIRIVRRTLCSLARQPSVDAGDCHNSHELDGWRLPKVHACTLSKARPVYEAAIAGEALADTLGNSFPRHLCGVQVKEQWQPQGLLVTRGATTGCGSLHTSRKASVSVLACLAAALEATMTNSPSRTASFGAVTVSDSRVRTAGGGVSVERGVHDSQSMW